MKSKEKELVKLTKIVRVTNSIEGWLNKVQDEMRNTLAKALRDGNKSYENEPRKAWVMKD